MFVPTVVKAWNDHNCTAKHVEAARVVSETQSITHHFAFSDHASVLQDAFQEPRSVTCTDPKPCPGVWHSTESRMATFET